MEKQELVLLEVESLKELVVESLKEVGVSSKLEGLRIEYSERNNEWDITIKLKIRDLIKYSKYNEVVKYLKEKLESKEIKYYMELEVESLSEHYKVKTMKNTFEALHKFSHSIVGWERI